LYTSSGDLEPTYAEIAPQRFFVPAGNLVMALARRDNSSTVH